MDSEASYREDQSERIHLESHISYCLKWIFNLVSKSLCDKWASSWIFYGPVCIL